MTINDAIYAVITTKFKKDMKEAKKVVRGAGYTITKCYGSYWTVNNPVTGKYVYLSNDEYYYKTFDIRGKRIKVKRGEDCKIDFRAALDKPINKEWEALRWIERRPTKKKYERLNSAKYSLRWRKQELAETQKKIAELQARLIRETRSIVEAENKVSEVRNELGLRNR